MGCHADLEVSVYYKWNTEVLQMNKQTNFRIIQVGRELRKLFLKPQLKAWAAVRCDLLAQGFIQSGPENPQGQRLIRLYEQPVPLFASPCGEEVSLTSSLSLSSFHFCTKSHLFSASPAHPASPHRTGAGSSPQLSWWPFMELPSHKQKRKYLMQVAYSNARGVISAPCTATSEASSGSRVQC